MSPLEISGSLPNRILLAAGGTGGHIYPAIALGQALLEASPKIVVRYCCGSRPGELEIYKSAGIDPIVLPLSGNRPGLTNRLLFLREMYESYRVAMSEVSGFKPDLAVGFGSYASVPALIAARRANAKIVIHEQNATPGLANRWLSLKADMILLGIPSPPGVFPRARSVLTGNPIRKELLDQVACKVARRELGLPPDEPLLLCFGGSLGAAQVNRMLEAALAEALPNSPWRVLWSSGPANLEKVRSAISATPLSAGRITLVPYLERMDLAYSAADLVVARAGAITLAELTALGKPSILIPLPIAGGHQRSNAQVLERAGGALVIDEADPEGVKKIATALVNLPKSFDKLIAMGEAAHRLGLPGAANKMVEAIAQLRIGRETP